MFDIQKEMILFLYVMIIIREYTIGIVGKYELRHIFSLLSLFE